MRTGFLSVIYHLEDFAEHLKAIDSIPADQRIADHPTGALVLAILAFMSSSSRTHIFSTGCEIVPTGSDGHFSQAVWGATDRPRALVLFRVKEDNIIDIDIRASCARVDVVFNLVFVLPVCLGS
ncbi:hypothetical protein BT96DRAFT_985292 [Gymnopus androsaceus JB14]|uniref:Uncharacterized protein n=1 Tax=Gymnopus androsaceus JB14 TaxID=1447944 RepID=A0A6A4IG64_9AGAR|nr:hypothetical protein BT96DRAFT_985292 [Gymnopus androsaceus JB14]